MENLLHTMILVQLEPIQNSKKRSFFNDSVKSRLLSSSIPFDSLRRYHYRSLPCSRSWTLNLLPVVRETVVSSIFERSFSVSIFEFSKMNKYNAIDSFQTEFKYILNAQISWIIVQHCSKCITISKFADRREFRIYVQ